MFEKFFPDEYLASTYIIPFEVFYQKGYRGVIFDIDNTLVPHGAPADERAKKLFARLQKIGLSSCLLSNNQKPRVEMFNQEIQTNYIYNAHKPSVKNYEKAMSIMGTTKEYDIVCRGSIVYGCMGSRKNRDYRHFSEADPSKRGNSDRLKRYLEKIVLHFYKKKRKLDKKG